MAYIVELIVKINLTGSEFNVFCLSHAVRMVTILFGAASSGELKVERSAVCCACFYLSVYMHYLIRDKDKSQILSMRVSYLVLWNMATKYRADNKVHRKIFGFAVILFTVLFLLCGQLFFQP